MEEENKMTKTIETIVMGLALATMLGCQSSNSGGSTGKISCTPKSDQYTYCNKDETNCKTYSKSAECANNGGTYSCSEVTNERSGSTHCACSCGYAKDPADKEW